MKALVLIALCALHFSFAAQIQSAESSEASEKGSESSGKATKADGANLPFWKGPFDPYAQNGGGLNPGLNLPSMPYLPRINEWAQATATQIPFSAQLDRLNALNTQLGNAALYGRKGSSSSESSGSSGVAVNALLFGAGTEDDFGFSEIQRLQSELAARQLQISSQQQQIKDAEASLKDFQERLDADKKSLKENQDAVKKEVDNMMKQLKLYQERLAKAAAGGESSASKAKFRSITPTTEQNNKRNAGEDLPDFLKDSPDQKSFSELRDELTQRLQKVEEESAAVRSRSAAASQRFRQFVRRIASESESRQKQH